MFRTQPDILMKKKNVFAGIANGWKSLTIFAKSLIFDIWQGSEYTAGHYTDSLM